MQIRINIVKHKYYWSNVNADSMLISKVFQIEDTNKHKHI